MTLMVPPDHIWNRYCMVPHIYFMIQMVPHTLYGMGILWSLFNLYGTSIKWSPHMYVWSLPHVKCLPVLYDAYGLHTLYEIGIVWSPTCTI